MSKIVINLTSGVSEFYDIPEVFCLKKVEKMFQKNLEVM